MAHQQQQPKNQNSYLFRAFSPSRSHLNSAAPQSAIRRQGSRKVSDIPPKLWEFCEANGIGYEWAAVLAAQEITPALLKQSPPVLSRAELTDLGLPLGVVATLLPRPPSPVTLAI